MTKMAILELLPSANDVFIGNVFTPVCQSFCSRGEGSTWAGTLPGQEHPPGQVHPTQPGTPPGRYTPRQIHPLAGTPSGRYTPWQVHHPLAVHAGIWSTSRWYASYWNALLFVNVFPEFAKFSDENYLSLH